MYTLTALGMFTNKFLAKNTKLPYAFLMIITEPLPELDVVEALTEAPAHERTD